MKPKKSVNILLVLVSLITLFHLCIITKLIPYTIAWGGRLENDREMYVFEAVSILLNALLALVLLLKGAYLKLQVGDKNVNAVLWVFFGIFALNTVGNLFAKTTFEKCFAALTLLFAVLIWNVLQKPTRGPRLINPK